MKKILIVIFGVFCIIFIGCRVKEREYYKLSINNVSITAENSDSISIDENPIIYYSENVRLRYDIYWEYVINNVTDLKDIPVVEYQYPECFTYYVYLNDEIIEASRSEKNEYKTLNYAIEQHFFSSNIVYKINSSRSFLIESTGNYEITYFFTFKINSKEIECSDSFTFTVL